MTNDSDRARGLQYPCVQDTDSARRPLLVTADADLLDELIRIADASGVQLTVAGDVGGARLSWPLANLVLVGGDLAGGLARAHLGYRPGVLLVVRQRLEQIEERLWKDALRIGVRDVIALPEHEARLAERLGEASCGVAEPGKEARMVCVVPSRGGSGASALAASLALTAHTDRIRSILIDGDPLGGGLDLVVGGEESAGVRWSELATTRERIGPRALLEALPSPGDLPVVSGGRGQHAGPATIPPEAMRAVLPAARRAAELLVLDLPRYLDAACDLALAEADNVLLVVPLEVRAVAAAQRVGERLRERVSPAADTAVVTRGPAPGGLTASDVAEAVGMRLAGALSPEHGLAARLERGEIPARPNGPLVRFCRTYLGELDLPPGRAA